MVNIWSTFIQAVGPGCPLCHAPGDGLCAACLDELPWNRHPCARCALPLPVSAAPGSLCAECQRQPPAFDRAVAPLLYGPPVDDLVAAFKYHHRLAHGRMLATILGDVLVDRPLPDLLLPVPAHAARLRERGFNQAAELAHHLARRLGVPWHAERLLRGGGDRPQRGLGRSQRRRARLPDAFRCTAGVPPRVALVDDVVTTAATVDAASRALRDAGAREIEVWAVARTPRTR